MLIQTATNFETVKRSPEFDGKTAVNNKVNRLDDDENTVTIPVSDSSKDA